MLLRASYPRSMLPEGTSFRSRRLLLRRNKFAVDQALGDLDGIERRALAQVVGNDPKHKPVLDGRILSHAADVGRVLTGAFVWRDVAAGLAFVDHQAAG